MKVHIFWFRRDLRLEDNAGLFHAAVAGVPVLPVFIFDRHILDQLEDKADRRVEFIHRTLTEMDIPLDARYGYPEDIFPELLAVYDVNAVFANHDADPYALARDAKIAALLAERGVPFETFKDHVIFEKSDVVKENGRPYTVFTPYGKRWRSLLTEASVKPYASVGARFVGPRNIPSLVSMGFRAAIDSTFPRDKLSDSLLTRYADTRDFPAANGTSRLGVHLRFGTVSIRKLVRMSLGMSEVYLNELIWREFYHMILWHFPNVGKSFHAEYDAIRWRNDESEFARWCDGRTGYPLVDAGMRELNATGYMHNRVRMVTASFLAKHLLIDWRWGEAYFASKLLDYDLASNNGGWQWAAGCGCDAAPYFRIFNPTLQAQKFDPSGEYIRRWVPEIGGAGYPAPMVVHEEARKRCLEVYKKALQRPAGPIGRRPAGG